MNWLQAAAGPHKPITPALVWLGGAIVLVVLAGLIVLRVRGAALAKSLAASQDQGLLAGLRKMRDAGEISLEEYDAARKSMASRASGKPIASRQVRPDETRAKPGFDLTGAPLPKPPPEGRE